jgi:hypothetical protein
MCEQCQAVDDEDDLDTLAAAFLARHGKAAAKPAAQQHALVDRRAPPVAAPPAKKVAP